MPSEDIKAPGRKSLLTAAAAAVLIAGIVLSYGFIGRAQSKQEVVDWTNTHAIPTVALAGLIPGSSHQTLTLPGNIQPFNRAAIFARVNGYVKNWDHDIGSPVRAGQVLATIDAPDLDQQLGQAKATLASVRANHQIASLTANRNNILLQSRSSPNSWRTRPTPTPRRRRPLSTPTRPMSGNLRPCNRSRPWPPHSTAS